MFLCFRLAEAQDGAIFENVARGIAADCTMKTAEITNLSADAVKNVREMIAKEEFFTVKVEGSEEKPTGLIFKEFLGTAKKQYRAHGEMTAYNNEVHADHCWTPGFVSLARDHFWHWPEGKPENLVSWKPTSGDKQAFSYFRMDFKKVGTDKKKLLVSAAEAHVVAVHALFVQVFRKIKLSLIEIQTNASIDVEGQVSLIDEQVAAGFAEQQTTGAEAASIDGLVEVQTHASIDGEGQVSLIDEQVAAGLAEQNTTGAEAASIDGLVEDQTHACTDGEGQVSDEQVAAGLAEQQTTGAEGASIDGEGQIAQTAEGSAADTPTNPKFRGENDVSGQGATSLHPVH